MGEIKSCPFCGSHGLTLGEHAKDCYLVMFAHWVLECHGAKLETHYTHDEMVKAWNTRAENAELERLRGLEATYVHTVDAHNFRMEDLENLARALWVCNDSSGKDCDECPFEDKARCTTEYIPKLMKELGLLEGE